MNSKRVITSVVGHNSKSDDLSGQNPCAKATYLNREVEFLASEHVKTLGLDIGNFPDSSILVNEIASAKNRSLPR